MAPSKTPEGSPLVVDGSVKRAASVEKVSLPDSPSQLVRSSVQDDPFVTTPEQDNKLSNPAGVPLPQISAIIQANLAHSRGSQMETPREDRLNQPVNARNAQGLFPKEAKLFVANLSNLLTNDQLEASVSSVFEQIGECVTIIKRDRNHQPMGFVQYQLIHDAEKAMDQLNGVMIDGRVIRLEWASARQELIISRLSNEPFPEAEARTALAGRGPIASVTAVAPPPSEGDGLLSVAWMVEFRYYADCKEALRSTRDNGKYRAVPAPKIPRQTPFPIAPPRTPQGTLCRDNDSKSIFVGQLPNNVTEDELRHMFAMFGTIEACSIISKPVTTGGTNTFAFVEFKYSEDAESAANMTQFLRGEKIRVERKRYAKRRAARFGKQHNFGRPYPLLGDTPQTPQYFNQQSVYTQAPPTPYQAPPMQSQMPQQMLQRIPQPVTPFQDNNVGFTFQDYYTTPPTPVYLAPQYPFASPATPAPRMRRLPVNTYTHGHSSALRVPIFPQRQQISSPTPATHQGMGIIPEELEEDKAAD